jgi:hypothetical protein
MKTEQLIEMLARDAGPAPASGLAQRIVPMLALGLALPIALAMLVWGPVPGAMWATPAPWVKLGYTLALAAVGWVLVDRLARPGARATSGVRTLTIVLLSMAGLGLAGFVLDDPALRMRAWMGHSWSTCPLNVLLFGLPGLALAFWVLRAAAPTRPRAAGAAAGLLAGALAAAGYSLACNEGATSFIATWYTLGVAGVVALGAAAGPRLLRW